MRSIVEILRFSGGIEDWKPEETVEKGYNRRVVFKSELVGGDSVVCILISNYDRKTGKELDKAELVGAHGNTEQVNWNLINQERSITWQANMLLIQGTRNKLGGFMGEYAASAKTEHDFTYGEQVNFGFVGSAATGIGTFVYQEGHGFETGQWVTRTDGGFVLAQPGDPVLRETMGVVTLVIGAAEDEVLTSNSFVVESFGYGGDPYYTGMEFPWEYDPGTVLYLDTDGMVTDTRPEGVARKLGTVWDVGYFHIDQQTLYPPSNMVALDTWPTDAQLRASPDMGGFMAFVYCGNGTHPMGIYANPNVGIEPTAAISQPTKL